MLPCCVSCHLLNTFQHRPTSPIHHSNTCILIFLQILDEVSDPGKCEIVRVKGAFALELVPKLPRPPQQEAHRPASGMGLNTDDFTPPENPTVRPRIVRWAGNTGVCACARPQQ
jgi:hypothetical protein